MAKTSYPNAPVRFSVLAVVLPLLCGCMSSGFTVPFSRKSETATTPNAPYPLAQSKANNSGQYPLAQAQQGSREWQATNASRELNKLNGVGTYPGANAARKISSVFRRAADSLTPSPRVEPAIDPTRLSSKHAPLGSELFVSSARLFEHQGNIQKAMASYARALEADPECRDALIGYARLEHRTGNLQKAVDLYQRAVNNNPNDATALNDMGLCLARLGQVDQAISTMNRAVDANPASTLYRNNVATLLVEVGRPEEALAHLEQAHGHARAHHNLGYLLKQRGETDLAMSYFARAIEVDPTLDASRAMLAEMSKQKQYSPKQWPPRHEATVIAPVSPARDVRIGARGVPSSNRPASYEMDAPPEPLDVFQSGRTPNAAPSPRYVPQSRLRVGPFGYEPTHTETR